MTIYLPNPLRAKLKPYDIKGCTLVYAYLRASDKSPYYVGVSTGVGRAIDQKNHRKHGISVPKDPAFVVVLRYGLTKEQAAAWETFYIRHYGRSDLGTGCLRNRTDGGEGLHNPSEETRAKIGKATSLRPASPKTIESIRAIGLLPKTQLHRQRISDGQPSKGSTHSPKHLAALRAAAQQRSLDLATKRGFNSVEVFREHARHTKRQNEKARKTDYRAQASALGMTGKSYSQWIADGSPSDLTLYLKPKSFVLSFPKGTPAQEKRKAERIHVGLTESQYRAWVRDGRPSNYSLYSVA